MLLKLYDLTGNSTYMTLAEPYAKATERLLPAQEISDRLTGFVGFQWSRVGMWSVLAAYYDRTGTPEGARLKTKYSKKITDLFDESTSQGKYDDFDSGRAGLIYASRFITENISPRYIYPLVRSHYHLRGPEPDNGAGVRPRCRLQPCCRWPDASWTGDSYSWEP